MNLLCNVIVLKLIDIGILLHCLQSKDVYFLDMFDSYLFRSLQSLSKDVESCLGGWYNDCKFTVN